MVLDMYIRESTFKKIAVKNIQNHILLVAETAIRARGIPASRNDLDLSIFMRVAAVHAEIRSFPL